jgi:hypothetical protein
MPRRHKDCDHEANVFVSIAYWIAFGPHGPRAEDPPGTGARVAWGIAVGLGVSVAIFGAIRAFAKPAPYTMTKEYQEMSNELLIVSLGPFPKLSPTRAQTNHPLSTEAKSRPAHWYHLRGLQGPRYGPVSSQERLNASFPAPKHIRRKRAFKSKIPYQNNTPNYSNTNFPLF